MRLKYSYRYMTVLMALAAVAGGGALADCGPACDKREACAVQEDAAVENSPTSDEEWRRQLTPEQYRVMREKGTERAFTGAYWEKKDDGTYLCAACGNPLFSSEDKFDSGTGWPSYTRPADEESVGTRPDISHGMTRTEVVCRKCEAHLGHVFDDGPGPHRQRYCINSVSLEFQGQGDGGLPDGPAPCEIPPGTAGE